MNRSFRGSDLEKELIHQLAQRAAAGVKEAGYLVDEDTSEILDYREAHDATPYQVDFPETLAKSRVRVCYLHSHNIPSPPGEDDWANVVQLSTLTRYLTVCGDHYYTLTRRIGTKSPFRVSPGIIFSFESVKRLKQSSLRQLSIKQAYRQMHEAELQQLFKDVNWTMSETYNVGFSEEPLP